MEAPFKVGQRVVFLDIEVGLFLAGKPFKKGAIYEVCELVRGPDFGYNTPEWFICVIGYEDIASIASNFAPIEEHRARIRHVAVSETLREKAVVITSIETNKRHITKTTPTTS